MDMSFNQMVYSLTLEEHTQQVEYMIEYCLQDLNIHLHQYLHTIPFQDLVQDQYHHSLSLVLMLLLRLLQYIEYHLIQPYLSCVSNHLDLGRQNRSLVSYSFGQSHLK